MTYDTDERSSKRVKVEEHDADSERNCQLGDVQQVEQRTDGTRVYKSEKTGAYSQREEFLIKHEADGDIRFTYVENNGDPHNMMHLISLKNIYSKQLPNMPKEYIVRLLLHYSHKSVVLLKRNGTVMGGITYRAFTPQGFGEIAFCAIASSEQVKGYGTRLMNYTKEYAVTMDRLSHFLTYADNNAVGYFTKQGFTKEITLDKARWQGYIKDYDGGTLMECVMHPKLRPAQFPALIRTQKAALERIMQGLSHSHIIHPGLAQFRSGQPASVPVASIPGVKEAGWSEEAGPPPRYRLLLKEGSAEVSPSSLHRWMTLALQEVQGHGDAWPFLQPVTREEVPDYHDIIKDPVDLSLIARRLAGRVFYSHLDIFLADFRRMFNNCRTYNSQDTIYYKLANKLEAHLDQWVAGHLVHMG
ncbi:chromatin remodeling complex WSTF-ISWI, large subunit [Haematococcus lacustris]